MNLKNSVFVSGYREVTSGACGKDVEEVQEPPIGGRIALRDLWEWRFRDREVSEPSKTFSDKFQSWKEDI